MSELQLSEADIKLAIKQHVCAGHLYMRLSDIAVHLEIGNDEVRARVLWEDNIRRDEQNVEFSGGC